MMEERSRQVVKTKAEWAAIIEGQERSGKSAARFCREQCIDYNRFLYRCKTLRKSNGSLAMEGFSRSMSVSGGFIPIRVEESASVRLRFPMGLVLESDRVPSAAWVVEVAKRWADPKGPRSAGGEGSPC